MTMTGRSAEFFSTKIMGLAAYLWFSGHSLTDTSWEDDTCTWKFERTEKLEADVEYYNAYKAMVDPRLYYPKIAEFKNLFHQSRAAHHERIATDRG